MIKHFKLHFFCLLLLLTSCVSKHSFRKHQRTHVNESAITAHIEKVINNIDPNVNIGIMITSLDNNKVVFQKNANRYFVPASTIKLLTLASALYYLGPFFRFETSLITDEINKDGSIKNIYLKGSGDPSLMDHDLISLITELQQMGIKRIDGNIFIDDQIFDATAWTKGAMWDDRDKGFGAPVSGLNLNYNRLIIKTVPAHLDGLKAHTITRPHTNYVKVESRVITKKNPNEAISLSVEQEKGQEQKWPDLSNEGLLKGDHIYVDGHAPLNSAPKYSLLAIKDPSILAGHYFKEQLQKHGIEAKGLVARKKAPDKAKTLTRHTSRSLGEALIDFTKISNNIATDCLLKAISAHNGEKSASFEGGLKLVKAFLSNEVGLDASQLTMADGAGVSRYNLITPEQMVNLLEYISKHFLMAPEFMAALPIAGEDGTLGSRFINENVRGQIRAKTGSFTSVSSLAGYINSDGARYAFAIMINGFIGSNAKYSRMQEDILATLFTGSSDTELAKKK